MLHVSRALPCDWHARSHVHIHRGCTRCLWSLPQQRCRRPAPIRSTARIITRAPAVRGITVSKMIITTIKTCGITIISSSCMYHPTCIGPLQIGRADVQARAHTINQSSRGHKSRKRMNLIRFLVSRYRFCLSASLSLILYGTLLSFTLTFTLIFLDRQPLTIL